MTSLPVILFSGILGAGSIATLGIFAGSTVYDIKKLNRERPLKKTPNARQFRRRPLISVIIIARNNKRMLKAAVESVALSDYRKLEIIVIDNGSTDDSPAIALASAEQYRKRNIKVVSQRRMVGDEQLLRKALRTAQGEFVMVMPAYCLIKPDAFLNALRHFMLDDTLQKLDTCSAALSFPTITSQARQLAGVFGNRTRKCLDVLNISSATYASVYRKQARQRLRSLKAHYANDVVTYSLASPRSQHTLRVQTMFWTLAFSAVCGLGYIGLLALRQRVVEPLGLLWLTTTVALLLFLCADELTRTKDKLNILGVVPLWFLFVCTYLLKQVLKPLGIIPRIRVSVRLAD